MTDEERVSAGERRFRMGLVINPYAGVGGPSAQKGSDAVAIQRAAAEGQLPLTAPRRAQNFLGALTPVWSRIDLLTVSGAMGGQLCAQLELDHRLVDYCPAQPSTFQDTERAAASLSKAGVDLLIFIGGDGTARDLCRVLGMSQLVLGVPAGVKMHSGVYAVNPQGAAEVVKQLVTGELVGVDKKEVRDIDEEAFRRGLVKSRYFGSMLVPDEVRYVQQVKQGGREVEELVLADIAADLAESMDEDVLAIFGPGSTIHQILQNMEWPSTLLGFDVFHQGRLLKADADGEAIHKLVKAHSGPVALYLTAIGGQGHIIGRGNQQLTAPLLRLIGRDNLHVIATKTKLANLEGRPFLLDSGDPELDESWSGYIRVLTGYHDSVLYAVGSGSTQGQSR